MTIYLWHWFAYLALMPQLAPTMPLAPRIVILVSAGLAFSTVVVMVGRRVLGKRSRILLGA